ncbi:Membrane protein OS=Streptomyces antimycoticus OX=68175 GN=SSPO_030370 PE=4 SV=1 [Streptomyces antimycoticus]
MVLTFAVLLALAVADLSGMSKAETERIWLPFLVWLLPTAALLPAVDRRRWLVAQACLGLLVNHLLLTGW